MKNKNQKTSIGGFLQGHILEDFVKKQSTLLFVVFILIILFITNRYWCTKQLSEMDRLKKEQTVLEYEQVKLTSEITKISVQSQIEKTLQESGIELIKNNNTVYRIKK